MAGLEELPPWAQVVASLIVAVVAVSAWLSGIVRRVGPPEPKDAIVLSAAIADSQALRSLGDAIREQNRILAEREELLREILHEQKEMNHHLEAILFSVRFGGKMINGP